MHRKTFLPRNLGWSLLIGFTITGLAQTASAQAQNRALPGFSQQVKDFNEVKDGRVGPKETADPYVLLLPKDSTRQIEMSTKELIAEFRSENPKVVKVQALLDNPRAVLVSGMSSGSTRVYLTDSKKNTESLEVRVPLDEEADREAKRHELIEQIQKAVPTARVDVLASANNTVVITGNVPHVDSVQVVMELARGMFGQAANVVNAMRIGGVQEVQIEVTVARVNRSRARNIGFSFLQTGQQHFLASTVGGGGNLTTTSILPSILNPSATLAATPNAVFGIFNDKSGFFGYLNALTTEGLAKLVAEPRVITLSGRPAYIVSGGETPILTTSGTGSPSVTYKTFGTVVNILPIVLGNGKIHLEVRPEISSINVAAGITIPGAGGTTSVPGFDLRSAQVTVVIEDGQTLAIGGLIQNSINGQNSKVPILGDLPIISFAFTSKTYTETEEELIILVTPHLVDPMACNQLPKHLPGRETRTPDDFELFLEGILEAPRGQRNLTHPYTAAYLNGPSASIYPCGDMSGSRGGCGVNGCSTNGQNCNCAPGTGVRPVASYQQKAAPGSNEPAEVRPVSDVGNLPAVPAVTGDQTPATLPPLSVGGSSLDYLPRNPAVFGPAVMTEPR